MNPTTEQVLVKVNEWLASGDEKAALNQLEEARRKANKASDASALGELIDASEQLQDQFTGRQARAFERFVYAARQNQALALRKTGGTPTSEPAASVDAPSGQESLDEADASDIVLRPDVEAAKARMARTYGARRELKKLDEYLWHDETVLRLAAGSLNGKTGLLVYSDRRLIFLFHGWMSQRHEDFPLDTINSVSVKTGMASGKITVFSGGSKHEIANVYKDDAKAIADDIRNRLATRGQAPAPSPPPTPAVTTEPAASASQADVISQIKQLGELRDAGILTNEEFETKKAELLQRI